MDAIEAAELPIDLPLDALRDFCRKWEIVEFSLFGSIVNGDFRPESDVDVMVSFEPEADRKWSLLDLVSMKFELEEMWGRKVDIATRSSVESNRNWIIRDSILSSVRRLNVA